MNNDHEEEQELEEFIQDWHWDEKSHIFARELGTYLFSFLDHLSEQGLSERTMRKHMDNCWCIGILECQYGYRDTFAPGEVFAYPEVEYEYEFKRKMSDSPYAMDSYRATWRKVHKYTKALGHIDEEE